MNNLSRYFILLTLGSFLIASLGLYLVFQYSLNQQLASASEEMTVDLDSRKRILLSRLKDLKSDILFLNSTPPIQGIVRASANNDVDPVDNSSTELWKQRLQTIYKSYLETQEGAYQVRYVGITDEGMELVRVEKTENRIFSYHKNQLQPKAHRDYFNDILQPNRKGIYFSSINLNRENKTLQIPYLPTLRIANRVYDVNGEPFGFVIINFSVIELFQQLSADLNDHQSFYITNATDDFLYHPNNDKSFRFDIGVPYRWTDEFSSTEDDNKSEYSLFIQKGHNQSENKFLILKEQVSIDGANNVINLHSAIPYKVILGGAYQNTLLSLIGLLIAVAILSAYFFIYRQSTQRKILVSREKARNSAVVEGSRDAIISVSLSGKIQDWNQGATELFGYNKRDAIGRFTQETFLPHENINEEKNIRDNLIRGENIEPYESERQCKDGRRIPVSISVSPIKDEKGKVIGISKIIRDISQQRKAAQAIEELNQSLEQQVEERTQQIYEYHALQNAILQNAGHAIIATDTQGIITLFNPAAEQLLGYSADELIGKKSPAIFHLEEEIVARAEEFSSELSQTIKPGFDVFTIKTQLKLKNEHQWTYVTKNGTYIPVSLSVTALYDKEGQISGYLGLASDITEMINNRKAIELAHDQLTRAAEVAQLGIWQWNVELNKLTWNDHMYEIYDLSPDKEVTYNDWYESVIEEQRDTKAQELTTALEGGKPFDTTFTIITPNNEKRVIRATAQVERDNHGNPTQVLGINRDITDQVHYEETLRHAKQASDQASKIKSEFVANMSHEIRTPMNAIIGLQQLLYRTKLDEKQIEYVRKSEAAADALLRIINDILDFSKIESGKLEIEPHPFAVTDLIDNLSSVLTSNLGDKNIELLFDLDPKIPDFISQDSLRLQQVLVNLAGNAIKFTNNGFVRLKLSLVEDNAQQALFCQVKDTGIGIAQDKLNYIFDDFTQAEASTERNYGGTGLGLAISKKLIELMGGKIKVTSTLNEGSCFEFTIPFETCEKQIGHQLDRKIENLNVLIIDDLTEAREALSNTAESLGWRVTEYDNPLKAIDEFENTEPNKRYDIVLMDWDMPSLNGWDASVRLKDIIKGKYDLKIIIVSAFGQQLKLPSHKRGKKIIEGVIEKPVSPSTLVNKVSELFSGSSTERQIHIPHSKRLSDLRVLLVEDNAVNRMVARDILKAEGAMITEAEDGMIALDILKNGKQSFDVVLMDIQMPGISGYQATEKIRNELKLIDLPIIAMTANVMKEDVERSLSSGMNAHVGKPFHIDELVSTVFSCLHHESQNILDAIHPTNMSTSENIETSNDNKNKIKSEERQQDNQEVIIDEASAINRLQGSRKLYDKTVNMFISTTPKLFDDIADNWTNDIEKLEVNQRALHTLKGLAATVGANQLSNLAKEIEHKVKVRNSTEYEQNLLSLKKVYNDSVEALTSSEDKKQSNLNQLSPHDVIERIGNIVPLLNSSNMKAIELLNDLEGSIPHSYSSEFQAIMRTANNLEFSEAAKLCEQLERMLDQDKRASA
ncbi:PAS domain S-box protein [Pleionea sediminis]|uniref:PAS domain S-box protein n=1 Tax=Pleionea sediminis TaxID=2569479 RepID=UPI0013DE1A2E|nr:PAS domain S-box protein [Pleionea sediminis]